MSVTIVILQSMARDTWLSGKLNRINLRQFEYYVAYLSSCEFGHVTVFISNGSSVSTISIKFLKKILHGMYDQCDRIVTTNFEHLNPFLHVGKNT
jgi:hypothetical protein